MSFLITRPRYEPVTHYFYHWSEEIVREAKKRIGKIFDLEKEKASKKVVESYLEKQSPEIIVFNGHGNDACIAGHNDEVLIVAGENSHLLKDKVVYMRSCDSGKTLGPQAIREGCKAFIGYAENSFVVTDLIWNMHNQVCLEK